MLLFPRGGALTQRPFFTALTQQPLSSACLELQHRRCPQRRHASTTEFEEEDAQEGEDDGDEDDGEARGIIGTAELDKFDFRDYSVEYILSMAHTAKLDLRPFYQRGYKWSQKRASVYIESILRGYPCIPEITLLENKDPDGSTSYAVFDGQQRLTSVSKFVNNIRGEHWKSTAAQRKSRMADSFALEGLSISNECEGKMYKDLTKKEQNIIINYNVRCAVIPSTWPMADYIEVRNTDV
jgi:hypothetical protein